MIWRDILTILASLRSYALRDERTLFALPAVTTRKAHREADRQRLRRLVLLSECFIELLGLCHISFAQKQFNEKISLFP